MVRIDAKVERLLPGPDPLYGFNIRNSWGKPILVFSYETQAKAEAARAQAQSLIEQALDVSEHPEPRIN